MAERSRAKGEEISPVGGYVQGRPFGCLPPIATIVPIRFRHAAEDADCAILTALRATGAAVQPGPARGVYELAFDTSDGMRLRRCVTDALGDRCPGWERDVEIFWPE